MTIIIRDATNTPRTITAIQVRDGGNVARDISEIWVRDSNNVPRQVFSLGSPLSVICEPDTVGGASAGTGVVMTDYSEALAGGGTPPYSYAWTVLSHSNVTPPTILFPTSASTTFEQTGVVEDDYAEFRCTVTDDNGATAFDDTTAFFQNVIFP